jgi:spore coat polysaccharide biosynthesis predicted glycosyltransferase SpsG
MPEESPETVFHLPVRTDTATIKPQFRAETLLPLLKSSRWDVVVVDMLDTDPQEMAAVAASGVPIVTFDDRGEGRRSADLLINVLVEEPAPDTLLKTKLLQGPSYVALAEEFGPAYTPPPRVFGELQRVFCSLGGIDAAGLSAKVAAALTAVPGLREVEFVVSAVEPQRSRLLEVLQEAPWKWTAPTRVPSTRERFEWCDLAVVAGGLTMHEVCRTGCPSIAVCQPIDHQFELGERLQEDGAMLSVGYGTEATVEQITQAVLRLCSNALREQMSHCGRKLVDGQGSDRTAHAILQLVGR